MFVELSINFEIFILTTKLFLNIAYFPLDKFEKEFFENLNNCKNNIISVKATKILLYWLFVHIYFK
jgi:hypothetical protein